MKLLLDIGNSRIKWAEWQGAVRGSGAVGHRGGTAAEAFSRIEMTTRPESVWVASVADDGLRAAAEDWAAGRDLGLRWATSGASACGVRNGYHAPGQLGVDRWLAVIAAYRRAGGACLVVDAGTALTLDAVTSGGQHLGGLIAPGLHLQRLSLRQHTQLDPAASDAPGWAGRDTDAAIALGTLHGCLGLIERVNAAISAEHGPMNLYLTGGDAEVLRHHLSGDWRHITHLVLEGLGHLADEVVRHDSLGDGT